MNTFDRPSVAIFQGLKARPAIFQTSHHNTNNNHSRRLRCTGSDDGRYLRPAHVMLPAHLCYTCTQLFGISRGSKALTAPLAREMATRTHLHQAERGASFPAPRLATPIRRLQWCVQHETAAFMTRVQTGFGTKSLLVFFASASFFTRCFTRGTHKTAFATWSVITISPSNTHSHPSLNNKHYTKYCTLNRK